jgi:beta-phosphoglucomutase-like phosphatase (HAD superfamily)
MRIEPVFLFDLDGTLVDSVYQHVLAWKEALDAEGIELSVWRIHRKIGMSGGLFTNQLLRETGIEISLERVESLRRAHAAAGQAMPDRRRHDLDGRHRCGKNPSAKGIRRLQVFRRPLPLARRKLEQRYGRVAFLRYQDRHCGRMPR